MVTLEMVVVDTCWKFECVCLTFIEPFSYRRHVGVRVFESFKFIIVDRDPMRTGKRPNVNDDYRNANCHTAKLLVFQNEIENLVTGNKVKNYYVAIE